MADAEKDDKKDEITVEKVEEAFKEAGIEVEKVAKAPEIEKNSEKQVVSAQEGVDELRRKLAMEAASRQEAERRLQLANQEAARARNDADASGMGLVDSAISALKTTKDALKRDYAQALANQDFERVAEIQDKMSDSAAKLSQLEAAKMQMANRPKRADPPPAPLDPVEAMASQLTPRSAAWVRAHPEYARDNRLRDKMIAAHNIAVADGYQPDTDDYFKEVEGVLRIAPQRTAQEAEEAPAPQRRASPAAAPVSRSGGAPGSNPRVVRLTADEIEIAEMSGLTPEQYAKNKLALRNENRLN